jgi:hypothetical protein
LSTLSSIAPTTTLIWAKAILISPLMGYLLAQ